MGNLPILTSLSIITHNPTHTIMDKQILTEDKASFEYTFLTYVHSMSCYGWNLTRFRIKQDKHYFVDFASKTGKDAIQHCFNSEHKDGLAYLFKVMSEMQRPRD